MWMMTQHAFSSTVFKQVEPGWYMMRFRDRDSANWVCKLADLDPTRVYSDLPSDYPLRMKISEEELVRYFLAEVKAINYSNFKNRAKEVRGATYAGALSKVWSAMWAITPNGLKEMLRKADDEFDRKHKLGKYAPKAQSTSTVRYTSGSHPSARDGEAESAGTWADAEWWYRNFPQQDTMERDSDFTDMSELTDDEADQLVEDIDRLFATKSVHDLTEDEWRSIMESGPGI